VGAKPAATFVETYALELPLSVREELLSDLARAVASPESAGLGEIARLREELDKTENARAWINSICPGLLTAFLGQQEADISDLGQVRVREAPGPEVQLPSSDEDSHEVHLQGEHVPSGSPHGASSHDAESVALTEEQLAEAELDAELGHGPRAVLTR
jgi:hypothetical protein